MSLEHFAMLERRELLKKMIEYKDPGVILKGSHHVNLGNLSTTTTKGSKEV